MNLFAQSQPPKPLAERMRPDALDEVLGQVEAKKILNAYVDQGEMPSTIFWGPPGCGKTTLSRLMAALLGWEGRSLNATSASVKEIRELAAESKEMWAQLEKRTLLFIDEIHRLNKTQQDVLLPIVESGKLTLAGSTTENPHFSLTQALRSRVQLIQIHPLEPEQISKGLMLASKHLEVEISEEALEWISIRVSGDLRLAYTALESAALLAKTKGGPIAVEEASLCLRQTQIHGDRKGDRHYDLASAYQKSLRGSDVNAAIYYLARFLASGEDPRFIARRLLITASEDVGNAEPQALVMAAQAFRAVEVLGMPEARIPLAQATLFVARAPKSNEAVVALSQADSFLKTRPLDPIPLHLRDSHYAAANSLGHGKNYVYSHDHPDQAQTFLPEAIKDQVFVPSKKERLDEPSLQWFHDYLIRHFETDQDWFEIDAESLAQELKWPLPKLRTALNNLVQSGKLNFKRSFKF